MAERKGTRGLELWCKRLVKDCPNVQIDNMTTSWRNGIAFCALVHYFRPDLIDITSLKPENIYENNQLAFSLAEKELGIPSLLDPEDMVANEIPDRLSILTYLSQFYQRLGHTVNTKQADSDSTTSSPLTEGVSAPIQFGKTGLEKCVTCGKPVYLAQRLMVSQKLYHRRCFRCTKCLGHMNPKNYAFLNGSDLICDSCKNENDASKFLSSSSDQMGMLAFTDDAESTYSRTDTVVSPTKKERPQSILEKIIMFEASDKKSTNLSNKLDRLSLNERLEDNKRESLSSCDMADSGNVTNPQSDMYKGNINTPKVISDTNIPEVTYKSDVNKHIFLQTQLSGDSIINKDISNLDIDNKIVNTEDCTNGSNENGKEDTNSPFLEKIKDDSNVTDDNRLANSAENETNSKFDSLEVTSNPEQEIKISVPPRRRKKLNSSDRTPEKNKSSKPNESVEYPDDLNPFSDYEEEALEDKSVSKDSTKKESTNPFGSSDEENDDVPPILPLSKPPSSQGTPAKRVVPAPAHNPFWSDGEEPTSEDESHNESCSMYKSPITTSTPNLPNKSHRRKKARAPPPPTITISESPQVNNTSLDDVASVSSVSSYNSTEHSDYKSHGTITPSLKKKRAPYQPDSLSTASTYGGSMETGVNISDGARKKGPAPGLPLPERREVKLQVTPEALQIQLDMLETQQLGLEKQGILIEQMIRNKCEGDEPVSVPQEEVEDLVIQLCEIVNEKNDLFRKQTELMYIRRQQRLEQEQADIEHEIRVIQSRPAVNRTDADKAREEQLVSRLVQIVRMRDELVQQLDSERRRERQEDIAIATSIAIKRAQRSSAESNSSTIKSTDVTVKKNKVKDKMKKQLKKAKHTLISKKKDDSSKEHKVDKEKKVKDTSK